MENSNLYTDDLLGLYSKKAILQAKYNVEDLIKEEYILDVYAKSKGDVESE